MSVAVQHDNWLPWKAEVRTATGTLVDLLRPDPMMISPLSIVRPLSRICRFNGHCNRFYSVAEHSVRVCWLVGDRGGADAAQFAGLMHDAAEAFTGDLWGPLKRAMNGMTGWWDRLEERIDAAISERFGCDLKSFHEEVKQADEIMLAIEKRDLMRGSSPQPLAEGFATLEPWSVDKAAAEFERLLWHFTRR